MDRLERENALLHKELDRVTAELEALKNSGDSDKLCVKPDPDVVKQLEKMTVFQHCALQGIMHCMSNEEIAAAMFSTPQKVKVYIYAVSKRLGVNRRDAIIRMVWDTYRAISDERYLGAAGIPKDWIIKEDRKEQDIHD
jgi:DNA-binding CsgD family transcriptional regulator